jgi:hypothetical protein
MSNYTIRGDRFKQLNTIIGSKIVDLFSHHAYNFKIAFKKLKLTVNIQICRNFSLSVSDQQYLILLHILLQIQASIMLNKQAYPTLIINRLHVNLRSHELIGVSYGLVLSFFVLPVLK